MNGMVALAGGLSVPVGAALLSLTALPSLRRPRSVRPHIHIAIIQRFDQNWDRASNRLPQSGERIGRLCADIGVLRFQLLGKGFN